MSRLIDQTYLRAEQYRTPANLGARANLHQRFSTNPRGWTRWLFEQIDLRPGSRVMEVGGGPGNLWRDNVERLPASLRFVFSDVSPGMLAEARRALAHAGWPGVVFAQLDAQAPPLPAGLFDVVIANHMLYHVPDLRRTVEELARILRPGGRLCAATNGREHMRELYLLLAEFDPACPGVDPETIAFRLDNAPAVLAPAFARVEFRRYADALWVTEAGPLADYAISMSSGRTWDGRRAELVAFLESRIRSAGGVHITKSVGLVIGYRE